MAKQRKDKPTKAKRERVDVPTPSGSAEFQIRELINEAICSAQAVELAVNAGSHELATKLRAQQYAQAEEAEKLDPEHKCHAWADYNKQLKRAAAKPKKPTAADVRMAEDSPSPPYPGAGVVIGAEPTDDDENGPRDERGLTLKQAAFVAAITGPRLGNATQAAIMAGYRELSARQMGSENLSKPYIAEAIRHALAKKCASPEWAKNQLRDLASGSIDNFLYVQPDGKVRLDFQKALTAGALNQIKEISFDPETGAPKIKLHDRIKALEILLRMHGLLKDQVEVTGADGMPLRLVVDVGAMTGQENSTNAPQSNSAAQSKTKPTSESS